MLPEAQVIQSCLEGSGIKTFLPDEFTIQNYWLWSNAIGGIRIQVREEDVEQAMDVLRESAGGSLQDRTEADPSTTSG